MRCFEIILIFLAIVLPFIYSAKKRKVNNHILLAILLGVCLLHGIFEGLRWQMSPVYLLHLLNILLLLKVKVFFKGSSLRKVIGGLFLLSMAALALTFSWILPVFDLPVPSGKYQVGTEDFHLITSNEELITDHNQDKREFIVKVWYPSKSVIGEAEKYLNKGERQGLAEKYGLPLKTFNYLNQVGTHTFPKAEIAEGKFPILVFSHGYYSNATAYYALIEEIVSQGYIVLNVNHTYESVGALFPDGEIKFYDKTYDRKHNNEEMASMIWNAMEVYKKEGDLDEKKDVVGGLLKKYFAAEITERWASDLKVVVDQIAIWESTTFLANHIDTSAIGVWGHSQGGAAAGQALLENKIIKAGMNIDGVQWGGMIDTFISKPFLLLSSDWPEEHPDFNEIAFQNTNTDDFYKARIKGSGHSSFMDIPFFFKLSSFNEAGTIKAERASKIASDIVVKFFDKYLKNKAVDINAFTQTYPELIMER